MSEQDEIKTAIQSIIEKMMERVMKRVLEEDPFIAEEHQAKKPLYAALVPDEIFKGSHFERRFVTPFGKAWENLAEVVAKEGLGRCEKGYTIFGNIKQGRLRRISEILSRLEHPESGQKSIKPNWDEELSYILKGKGKDIPVQVVCDLYIEDEYNKKYAFELKAPLPNSDQTKVSKEKLLKLYCMNPSLIDEAYFALPYNPYKVKENYAWSFPQRWFNMNEDKVVLIGNEFWDKIGGEGTYHSLIDAVNEIGKKYQARIYREFLGIEPQDNNFFLDN